MPNLLSPRLAWVLLLLAGRASLSFLPHRATRLCVASYEDMLGTSLEIKLAAAAETLQDVDRLNRMLSGYDPTSGVSQWLRAGKQPVAVNYQKKPTDGN